uniref:Lysosomal protein transmembrane 5 n=1 Tax=Prolemur simus TaxID=1328070 RepID=A0A8C8Z7E4_PROSS
MLFVISLSLLLGVVKNREKYLLPFLSLQIMDFLLCLLTLLGSYIELPAYLKLASRSRPGPSKVPLMTLQLLDFCLSILTLCSSYMEVPTYLNFKSMNHMNYLPSQDNMTHNQFIKMMIIFSIAFVTVLVLKVSGPRGWGRGSWPGAGPGSGRAVACSRALCLQAHRG